MYLSRLKFSWIVASLVLINELPQCIQVHNTP